MENNPLILSTHHQTREMEDNFFNETGDSKEEGDELDTHLV